MNSSVKKTIPARTEIVEQKSTEIIPVENQLVKNDADIDGFITKRQEFIQKVNAICVEGKDYHVIQGRKSLAKGGAEKIASIFHWQAKFDKDTESLEMLGAKEGLVAFKCSLTNGQFVGEGRGAATLQKNSGDPNKTLKMAQKSAFIDAVLRASGLSDFYTQDLEDMPKEEIGQPKQQTYAKPNQTYAKDKPVIKNPEAPASVAQINTILKLSEQKGRILTAEEKQKLNTMTKGKASEIIDALIKSKPKAQEELPVIQQAEPTDIEMSPEDKALADSIPF